jgi:hypothetical protein
MMNAFAERRYEANQLVRLTAEAMFSARRGRVKEGGFGEWLLINKRPFPFSDLF